MTQRYKILGIPRELLEDEYNLESLQEKLANVDEINDFTCHAKSIVADVASILILDYCLLDKFDEMWSWMPRALDFAEDYFFGDWRDKVLSKNGTEPPNREYWDIIALWNDAFQSSILWCACLGQWDRAKRFAGYVRDDIGFDPEQSGENRAWLILLAGVLRNRPWKEVQPFQDTILNGSRKREKLLLGFLDAILHGDDKTLHTQAQQYWKYYKSSESKAHMVTSKVAIDGTILLYYAEHLGRTVDVPDNVALHIVPKAA